MESVNRSLILNADDIRKKIERISYEILEENYDEGEIILAGIRKNGFVIIVAHLSQARII